MKPLKTVPDIKNTIPKLTWDGQFMKLFSMLKIRHLLLWDHYYLEIIKLVTDEEFEAWRKSWLQVVPKSFNLKIREIFCGFQDQLNNQQSTNGYVLSKYIQMLPIHICMNIRDSVDGLCHPSWPLHTSPDWNRFVQKTKKAKVFQICKNLTL